MKSLTPQRDTDLNHALQEIKTLVTALGTSNTPNVIFLSDGYDEDFNAAAATADAQDLRNVGVNLNAFGIGPYSTIETLQAIDPNARQLLDVKEFVNILGGWDPRYAREPLVEGATVYLDTNNNGKLDDGEPWRVTRQDNSISLIEPTPYQYIALLACECTFLKTESLSWWALPTLPNVLTESRSAIPSTKSSPMPTPNTPCASFLLKAIP